EIKAIEMLAFGGCDYHFPIVDSAASSPPAMRHLGSIGGNALILPATWLLLSDSLVDRATINPLQRAIDNVDRYYRPGPCGTNDKPLGIGGGGPGKPTADIIGNAPFHVHEWLFPLEIARGRLEAQQVNSVANLGH